MSHDLFELLAEAEGFLGGFMGSASSYRRVEELREKIRAALREHQEHQRLAEQKPGGHPYDPTEPRPIWDQGDD